MIRRYVTAITTISRLCCASLLVSALSGCALIHDDMGQEHFLRADQIQLADDIRLANDRWPQTRWWRSYQDPQLDALIERALKQSPNMLVVRGRVAQAQAHVKLLEADSREYISATGSINRQHVSENGFLGPYGIQKSWYNQGTVGIGGGYSFDIWGKERAKVNAALGEENASLAEKSTVELEIATTVAQVYFSLQTTLKRIDLLEQIRDIENTAVSAHAARVQRGLEAHTAVASAESALAHTKQQIAAARSQVKQLREALRALLGANAQTLPTIRSTSLPLLQTGLPTTLSYELLARRPDLQALRWYVQASLDQVDAAKMAFYPQFDIKAFFGFDSLHLNDLWQHSSQQRNLLPGVSLPIFDGNRLNANLQSARAASNTLIAQYNQAILNAVRDVAIAGARLQGIQLEHHLQTTQLQEQTFLEHSVHAHYMRGLSSRLAALEAKLPVLAQQMNLLNLQERQIEEEISLIKALGGGYRHNPDSLVASEK